MGMDGDTADAVGNVVLWILAIEVVAIICWDTWVTVRGEPQHTITEIVYRWSSNMPGLPFAVGFLCGHLFWRR